MGFDLVHRFKVWKDSIHPNRYELKEYVIKDGKKHPVAIICPGGAYWMVCSYVEGEPFAKALNKLGYSAFVVYYRVKDKARYPAPQDDLARAVREVLAGAQKWNLDVEHYSVWGSSAGGHLVASFGTEHMGYRKYDLPKPGALVLTYPVVTMGEKTHEGSRDNLLGPNASEEALRMASVERQITEHYPSTFVWCGDSDTCVPPENSRMLAKALQEKGIAHKFLEYSGIDHGVGLGKGMACEGWFREAVAFWEEQRKP